MILFSGAESADQPHLPPATCHTATTPRHSFHEGSIEPQRRARRSTRGRSRSSQGTGTTAKSSRDSGPSQAVSPQSSRGPVEWTISICRLHLFLLDAHPLYLHPAASFFRRTSSRHSSPTRPPAHPLCSQHPLATARSLRRPHLTPFPNHHRPPGFDTPRPAQGQWID